MMMPEPAAANRRWFRAHGIVAVRPTRTDRPAVTGSRAVEL
jgi:hypothetical protein